MMMMMSVVALFARQPCAHGVVVRRFFFGVCVCRGCLFLSGAPSTIMSLVGFPPLSTGGSRWWGAARMANGSCPAMDGRQGRNMNNGE